jgi:hypothetical protein
MDGSPGSLTIDGGTVASDNTQRERKKGEGKKDREREREFGILSI